MSKKIMFNDKYGLTQAVLNGRKTMTRRIIEIDEYVRFPIIRFRPLEKWEKKVTNPNYVFNGHVYAVYNELDLLCHLVKPRYEMGEVVAIAQSYKDCGKFDVYKSPLGLPGWRNKMFVKAELMPHHIEITGIKIERLQDISDEDCLKEGIYRLDSANGNGGIAYSFVGASDKKHIGLYNTPRDAFSALIDKVSGRGTWESNPYVWVYEFELFELFD